MEVDMELMLVEDVLVEEVEIDSDIVLVVALPVEVLDVEAQLVLVDDVLVEDVRYSSCS